MNMESITPKHLCIARGRRDYRLARGAAPAHPCGQLVVLPLNAQRHKPRRADDKLGGEEKMRWRNFRKCFPQLLKCTKQALRRSEQDSGAIRLMSPVVGI
jgi:hypothetical protein